MREHSGFAPSVCTLTERHSDSSYLDKIQSNNHLTELQATGKRDCGPYTTTVFIFTCVCLNISLALNKNMLTHTQTFTHSLTYKRIHVLQVSLSILDALEI